MKYTDKEILDYLNDNYFSQSPNGWDELTLQHDTSIWRFYLSDYSRGTLRERLIEFMYKNGV